MDTMKDTTKDTRTANPWTNKALANDYHLGDRREARLIAEENGNDPAEACGKCGGAAHYRHTVGAVQCTRCYSVHIRVIRVTDGALVDRWS